MQKFRFRAVDSSVIWMVIALHVVQGGLMLISPESARTTAMTSLMGAFHSRHLVGFLMIGFALGAAGEFVVNPRTRLMRLAFLIPQQVLLMIVAVGAVHFSLLCQFGDGVPRPWAFIFSDQLPAIIIACAHTWALLNRAWEV